MGITKEAKVGFVFFAGLALLLLLTVIIGRGELRIQRRHYHLDVLFENIQGLRRNDVVELSGMEIGRVDSISLEDELIRVRLRIDRDYNIRQDASIAISERSLIGGKMVSITMGESEEILPPGSVVTGKRAPTPLELIERASGFAEEMDEIMPQLESLLRSLNRISESIEKGEGTIGKLISEDTMYYEMTDTLQSAREVTGEVKKYAERIDMLKTYIGADSAYNFDTYQMLTGVYLRIEPRPDKLYLIGGKALTGKGSRWTEEDDTSLELDLQLGRRWMDNRLTGRVGVLESRVGAGIDYQFNERLSVSLEGRDVWTGPKDEGISPFLLRGRLNISLAGGLSIHTGIDNMLDSPSATAGLRFEYSDEDIKHLIGVLGLGR